MKREQQEQSQSKMIEFVNEIVKERIRQQIQIEKLQLRVSELEKRILELEKIL